MPNATPTLLGLTTQIVTAHLRRTPMAPGAVPKLIGRIHAALARAAMPKQAAEPAASPAAPSRTVFPDYILCLEDGRKLKTLKRHLRGTYGLSPEQYREKWGLPPDYPMVAPNYAERRSKLAKQLGLGRRNGTGRPPAAVLESVAPRPPELPQAEPPQTDPPAAEPPRAEPPQTGPALTAASVFARFPKDELEPEPEPEAATSSARKRQPFAKQRARTMQR